ncbi:MAG: hypothetical protein IKD00_06880 [Candidatus Methanomethylophilaceae archaeon]|nr:hypothetical protein [Candidatus Methanomethylophilaceae archaeon]
MKSQTKAIIASLVVVMMSVSMIYGVTGAWWSDSENTEISVTTGFLDVSTSGFYIKQGNQVLTDEGMDVPESFTIEYDGDRDSITGWYGDVSKLILSGNVGDDADVEIGYNVKFTSDLDYRFLIDVIFPDNVNGDVSSITSLDNPIGNPDEVKVGEWASLDDISNFTKLEVTYKVVINIDSLNMGVGSSKMTITNIITQYMNDISFWHGVSDVSWYNDTDDKFELDSADQLAGLRELVDGGNTFEGKTVVLTSDMDLQNELFDPIGSGRKDLAFKGTFDGQGHTIYNLSQNTWALDNGYYYDDLGLGLFGKVEDATIKNLVMDGASISGESGLCGTVAAVASGECRFENITVRNSEVADYQYHAGGVVGYASGKHTYTGINVEASTTVAAQWGDFNNACGGIIGGASADSDTEILMKDCTVACRIDAFNDVTSAYEWYSYRRCGMLIGDSEQMDDPDGNNVGNATASYLTCENVTVIYDDWANYTYCQFGAMEYPWVREQAGVSTGEYSNPRYGHPIDANGNTVVDVNHVHNEDEEHQKMIIFDQLYGGSTGDRYCTYGTATHDGVTVIYNNK